MNLTEWARAQGIAPRTAYRWFREGILPVPAERVGPRTIPVDIDANTSCAVTGGVGLYARVSSRDQEVDLERQIRHGRGVDVVLRPLVRRLGEEQGGKGAGSGGGR